MQLLNWCENYIDVNNIGRKYNLQQGLGGATIPLHRSSDSHTEHHIGIQNEPMKQKTAACYKISVTNPKQVNRQFKYDFFVQHCKEQECSRGSIICVITSRETPRPPHNFLQMQKRGCEGGRGNAGGIRKKCPFHLFVSLGFRRPSADKNLGWIVGRWPVWEMTLLKYF